ncbi:NfeD family protein [Inquilinus limosus]|uniref:NfeD family protein n=1 Tax=Inquilinus limosus TaxID=171674 RepID=UPI00047D20F7|nr:NfeD family protein [Inquilinus limosus]
MIVEGPEFWWWWIGGVVLLILEVMVPGTFFLWLAISAGVVGLLSWLIPLGWEAQVLIFALLSVVAVVVWRVYLKPRAEVSDQPTLNRRGEQYIGRVVTLTEPIVNGVGRVRIADNTWSVEGPDLPAGTRIRIAGVVGTRFSVERAAE